MAENIGQDIDKETLVSLLKDKSKEMKSLTTKLSKIEEKYIKIFKDQKNLLKDREITQKIINTIFDNDSALKFLQVEPGNYEINVFIELWNKKEEEKARVNSSKIENLESKITQLQNKINENKIQVDVNLEKDIKALKQKLSELESINSKLTQEISEINEIISQKNNEIQDLKEMENNLATLKAEILMKELKSKAKNGPSNIQYRINENEKLNEILLLKNELEQAYDKSSQYEKVIENLSKFSYNQNLSSSISLESHYKASNPNSVNKIIQEHQISTTDLTSNLATENASNSITYLDLTPEKIKHEGNSINLIEISLIKEDQTNHGRLKRSNSNPSLRDQLVLNQEYLKNVMLKYFLYIAKNNIKEATILEQAICTVLKMNRQEKDMIENAKKNNSTWISLFDFTRRR